MTEDVSRRLARALRTARARLGLTQAEVAERARLTVEAYARLERGKVIPLSSTLRDLAKALQVSTDVLLGLADEPPPPPPGEPSEMRRLTHIAADLDPRALRVLLAVAVELKRGSARAQLRK